MRKKTNCLLSCLLFLAAMMMACSGDNGEREARGRLDNARKALQEGRYGEAKMQLDSIRLLYPKAFEARREGIALMQQVDLAEQQRTLAYLDSTLVKLQSEAEQAREGLVMEKDTLYQEVGNYLHPAQTVEAALGRSFLRGQVDELGNLSLTSIYYGARGIDHTAVKVVAGDGTFAQTPNSEDIYKSNNLGYQTEKADYPQGKDGGVAAFVALNHGKQTMKVQFLGGPRSYTSRMRPADSEAITRLYRLSQVLTSVEQVKKEREEALRKIAFVERKMKESK